MLPSVLTLVPRLKELVPFEYFLERFSAEAIPLQSIETSFQYLLLAKDRCLALSRANKSFRLRTETASVYTYMNNDMVPHLPEYKANTLICQ